MKSYYYTILTLIAFTLFLSVSNPAQATTGEYQKEDEFFYGFVLNEKGNKTEIDKIKKTISKEYQVINLFQSYEFLTFSSSEEIDVLNKKLSKYGQVVLLPESYYSNSDPEPLWNLSKINVNNSKIDIGLTGKNINVAVIDSGVTHENPELLSKISSSYYCFYDLYNNLPDSDNFYYENCKYNTDENDIYSSHGSHVAGSIASNSFGVSPGVNLYDFRVATTSSAEKASLDSRAIYTAYEHIISLIDNGLSIDILNMSYGKEFRDIDPTTSPEIANAIEFERTVLKKLHDKNVLLVASSGNPCRYEKSDYSCADYTLFSDIHAEDENKTIPHYPSDHDFVISVGASDEENNRGIFGNKISGTSSNLDIVAPGTNIKSIIPVRFDTEDDTSDGFELKSGTSMAAPHISGILALYKENYPTFSPSEIEGMLYESSTNLGDDDGWDRVFGYGLATAVPPKHFAINKKITLNGDYNFFYFASDKDKAPESKTLNGEYHASRATGWDSTKKRFSYYRLSNPTTGENLGWIKADDTMNNIEADRESFTFTSDSLKIYSDANEASYEETITINPDRIREHVSEDKADLNPETGHYEWFKVNIPEYEINNKWIFIPNLNNEEINNEGSVTLIDYKYKDIKFKDVIVSSNSIFYDDPQTLSNPISSTNTRYKDAFIDKGYDWVESKMGYRWYRVSIPELNIHNKWIDATSTQWGQIHRYGLMDEVAGRSIEEFDFPYFDRLKENSTISTGSVIKPDSFSLYRFEQPVTIKQILAKSKLTNGFSNLKIDLLDSNKNLINTISLNSTDVVTKILDLSEPIDNVKYFKIYNSSSTNISLDRFDLFGEYDLTSSEPIDINFETTFISTDPYTFYDDPILKSNPQKISGTRYKHTIVSAGYHWIEEKQGFRWYKVSIPDAGIVDKWVNIGDNQLGQIYNYGLMDQVAGRSIKEKIFPYFDRLKQNSTISIGSVLKPNSYVFYRFEQPVNVENLLIERHNKTPNNNSQLKIEFFDEFNQKIGNDYLFDNNNDFFKQFFKLPDVKNGVYSYKLSNVGTGDISLERFDLFGSFNQSSLEPHLINFETTFISTDPYIFYDDPILKTNPETISGTRYKHTIVSSGYHWIEEKQGFRWYKVSIPDAGIVDKWVNIGDSQLGQVYNYGLMDQVSGRSIKEFDIPYFDRLKENSTISTGVMIKPSSQVIYRFEQPVDVESVLFERHEKIKDNNSQLKIEFFDEYNQKIGDDYLIDNANDFFKQFVKLSDAKHGVYSYKLSNIGTGDISLKRFDLFGTFEQTGLKPYTINFETTFISTDPYTFYDDPILKSNPQNISGTRYKHTIVSAGYHWIEEKQGFRWYKVSIPDAGIVDKWVNITDNQLGQVYNYGLMDQVSGRSTEEINIPYFDRLKNNSTINIGVVIAPSSHVIYRFEQPVDIDRVLFERHEKIKDNNSQLKIEFFDEHNQKIGNDYLVDNHNDFFKQFSELPESKSGVYSYKLSNIGTDDISLKRFDLFGSYSRTALSTHSINFETNFISTDPYTFYDDPILKSNPQNISGTRYKHTIVSAGYHWIEEKQGFRWYKISIPDIGIFDKWVEIGDSNWRDLHKLGLLDTQVGNIVSINNFTHFNYLLNNQTTSSGSLVSIDSSLLYTFDEPVNIDSLFISNHDKFQDTNSQLKIEFFDELNQKIGNDYLIDNNEDYFRQFIILPETKTGVYSFKLSNIGSESISLKYFDLYGN